MSSIKSQDQIHQVLGELIGSGKERHCYAHPTNPLLCIKITQKGVIGRRQNLLDWTYYLYLKNRGINSPSVPKCYGWVSTDQGPGLLVERICRADSSPAPTLLQAINTGEISRELALKLVEASFLEMIQKNIVVVDYHPDHMLVSEDAKGQRHIVVVDGLGSRHLGLRFWLRTRIPAYGRKKTRAVWNQVNSFLGST